MQSSGALRLVAIAVLVSTALPGPVRAQTSAALLVQFRGQVKVYRGEARDEMDARVGLRLQYQDRVEVPRGGRAVLLLRDGRLLTTSTPVAITPAGVTRVSELFGETVGALDRVAGAEPPPREEEGGGRPAPGTARPLAPAGGVTILEPRPRFVWSAAEGAEGYTIQIRPMDGGRALRFQAGRDTAWGLPEDAMSLRPGAGYQWTVVPGASGRAAAQESFRVAGAPELRTVAEFFASLEEQGVDPREDGLFLTAVFFNELGLVYEARRALDALLGSGLPLGADVHRLRAEVYRRIGDLDAALQAYEEAEAAAAGN